MKILCNASELDIVANKEEAIELCLNLLIELSKVERLEVISTLLNFAVEIEIDDSLDN